MHGVGVGWYRERERERGADNGPKIMSNLYVVPGDVRERAIRGYQHEADHHGVPLPGPFKTPEERRDPGIMEVPYL